MAATERDDLAHAYDSERSLARSLATRLRRESPEITIGLREIRDALPDHKRLTLQRRRALQRAFEDAGLVTSPSLEEAELDATIEVRLAEPRWRRRFRVWIRQPATTATRIILAILGAVAAGLSIAALLPEDNTPSLMSGDVNVLVAPLDDTSTGAGGLPLAESLSRALHTVVPPFKSPRAPDVQIRGPEGTSVARNPRDAEELAKINGAQIVVYGAIARRHGDAIVQPKLFVDPRSLVGAEELGGDYAFKPIDLGRLGPGQSFAERVEFRAAVANQLEGLAALTIGLGWFNSGRWEEAERWFERSRNTWPRGERRALAELFVGNAAGKQGHFPAAEAAYRLAAEELANPDRALLGMAQVELNRAQGVCDERADADELRRLAARFAVIGANAQLETLPGRALVLRARLGEARANLCLSLASEPRRHQAAVEGFRQVLALGSPSADNFRAELAEARGGLGLALLQPGSFQHSPSTYRDARSQYLRARSLTNDPARERVFAAMIELIEDHLYEEETGRPVNGAAGEGPSTGETIWGREDPLPSGVRRQVTRFYGTGDVACSPREPAHPRIQINEQPYDPGVPPNREPELGEAINVCVQGMPGSDSISLSISGPGGFSRNQLVEFNTGFPTQTYGSFWINLRWPLGRYEAVAVQGTASVRTSFRVVKPLHRGVRTPALLRDWTPSRRVPVLVVGASPNRRVPVDVYRVAPETGDLSYATSFTVRTNEDGYGETWLPIGTTDEGSFSMRLRGGGRYWEPSQYGRVRICNGPCDQGSTSPGA